MKNFKPSKFLLVSLSVALMIGAFAVGNADATSSTRYNRSVREMMARRHHASSKLSWFSSQNKAQQRPALVRSTNRATAPASVRTARSSSQTNYAEVASTSSNLAAWFSPSDKDGSLFPGGPCKNCHSSGPLIDTGPCERCYNSGPLVDTGPCERCYDSGPLVDTGPCERCYDSGPLVDTGPCERCYDNGPLVDTGPCEKCEEPAPVTCPCTQPQYAISYNDYVVQAMARDCCAMAPLYLEHVDFNLLSDGASIKNKMGNYRFRIFGCRRFDKEAVLNHGRVMEKNMRFSEIFEQVTGDCYNIVKIPDDLCLEKTPSPLPEYILTAEITNFFMNVCDGYDWDDVQKTDKRTGSSEITVKWKLSNLSKTTVVWEGETTGYADLNMGEEQGEIALVEAAFADAVSNLQTARGFEDQLMVRLSPEELTAERNALIDEERALDPVKCHYAEPLYQAKQCELTRPEANIRECPAMIQKIEVPAPCVEPEPCPVVEEASGITDDFKVLDNCIDENGGVISGGDCQVVDDTWVDTDVKAFDRLCITTRAPYDVLSPENLYKVRASVVEISNVKGKKGAGLIVSENFILTSADLVDHENNVYKIRTINGKELEGRVVRVNPSKNTALVMLSAPTEYTPLALKLDLPKVGETGFMTLGMLDVEEFDNGSENYIDNSGKILGYRYSDSKGSEIIVDTNVQDLVIGSVLIDGHGSVNGVAHIGQKTDAGKDLFLPTETALRSLGLEICDCAWEAPSPFQQTVYKPVTELIQVVQKAPEEMKAEDRK